MNILKADIERDKLQIVFRQDVRENFNLVLEKVRTLQGRHFDNNTRSWTADITEGNIQTLLAVGFEFGGKLKA
jgi:hypothetical protein